MRQLEGLEGGFVITSLKDKDCINRVDNFWRFWRTNKCKYDNIIEWWEMGKYQIRDFERIWC